MVNKSDMPDVVYIWGCPKSIGDLGFTRTDYKEGHVKYHADHIVQRLEAEKTELVEVLQGIIDHTAIFDGYEVCQEDDFSNARLVLQKHKGD